eukprot:scaffold24690_cov33-Tisochrysis_lutea.AAC.4
MAGVATHMQFRRGFSLDSSSRSSFADFLAREKEKEKRARAIPAFPCEGRVRLVGADSPVAKRQPCAHVVRGLWGAPGCSASDAPVPCALGTR